MRVVLPTDENSGYFSKRGSHFGKAKFYTIITLEDGEIVDIEGVVNTEHNTNACNNVVANIMSLNPDALIVDGIGAQPALEFVNAGLFVYFDQNSSTVDKSVELFVKQALQKTDKIGTC